MPVEARLKVEIKQKYKNNLINEESNMLVLIPLSVNTLNITKDYNQDYSDNIYSELENKNTYIIISCILFVLSIIILVLCFSNKFMDDKNYMKYKFNKILKYYEQIIVVISNPPIIDKNSILKVDEFKDMIDLNRELKQPILYYDNKKGIYGIFLIIDDNITYIYEITTKKEKI